MFMNKRDRLVPEQKPLPAKRNVSSTGFRGRGSLSRKSDRIGGRIPGAGRESSERQLDWDDISLSSEDSKSFKRFFKKGEKEPPEKDVKKISTERPKTSRGASDARITGTLSMGRPSTSSALNRFAAIEAKIKNRQDTNMLSLSGSDFALDVSSDAEVKRDIGRTDVKLRETLKNRKKEAGRNVFLTLDDTSETSEDASRRNQFLKDKGGYAIHDTDSESNHSITTKRASKAASYGIEGRKRESHSRDASKSTSNRKVTFSTELHQGSDIDQSLDDFIPPNSVSSDDPVSLNDFLHSGIHNVMSLDDLVPSEEIQSQKEEDARPTSALGFVGLHSMEELMPGTKGVQSSTEFVPSMQEDIHSESSHAEPDMMANVRSLEDLLLPESEKPPQKEKSRPVFKSHQQPEVFRSPKLEEESEIEEIVSESPNYSEDFHSDAADDDTLKDTESIAQDIPDELSISTSISTKLSDGGEEKSSYSSYSSSLRSSSTITSESTTPRIRKPRRSTVTTQTQTDTTAKPWIPGLSFVDSAYFKPTRLVQGEILDVLSAQNPASVALQDLLKQQLDLTREFISKARILHDRAVDSIPKDYVYGHIDEARLERLKKIWYDDYLDKQ